MPVGVNQMQPNYNPAFNLMRSDQTLRAKRLLPSFSCSHQLIDMLSSAHANACRVLYCQRGQWENDEINEYDVRSSISHCVCECVSLSFSPRLIWVVRSRFLPFCARRRRGLSARAACRKHPNNCQSTFWSTLVVWICSACLSAEGAKGLHRLPFNQPSMPMEARAPEIAPRTSFLKEPRNVHRRLEFDNADWKKEVSSPKNPQFDPLGCWSDWLDLYGWRWWNLKMPNEQWKIFSKGYFFLKIIYRKEIGGALSKIQTKTYSKFINQKWGCRKNLLISIFSCVLNFDFSRYLLWMMEKRSQLTTI